MTILVQVRVGEITAKCPQCGGNEFALLADSPTRQLACRRCGTVTTRHELLDQIAEEAMHEARTSLERLRAQSRRYI
jgi:uncharacterized Zn finger protein